MHLNKDIDHGQYVSFSHIISPIKLFVQKYYIYPESVHTFFQTENILVKYIIVFTIYLI